MNKVLKKIVGCIPFWIVFILGGFFFLVMMFTHYLFKDSPEWLDSIFAGLFTLAVGISDWMEK